MTSELTALFEYYEKEKGIDRPRMVEALSSALLAAAKRSIGPARELRIDIDADNGSVKAWAKLLAVETVTNPYEELPLKVARKFKQDAEIGDEIDVEVTPKDFGRIAAQTEKQTMMQRLHELEKAILYDEFKASAGRIVSGTIRRFLTSDVFIKRGKYEEVMRSREGLSTEDHSPSDSKRFCVKAMEDNSPRGRDIRLERTRNIGICAHVGAGKTTLTERVVFYTGMIHKRGEVHEGAATTDVVETDLMGQEMEHGFTITSAALTTHWRQLKEETVYKAIYKTRELEDIRVNIIDTSGHGDFTAEVERSLSALDGAIVVICGVAGVQPQSETVYGLAEKYGVPRVAVVNEMDRAGANFANVEKDVREKCRANAWPILIPIGAEDHLSGQIVVVNKKSIIYFDDDHLGSTYFVRALEGPEIVQADEAYSGLLEEVRNQVEKLGMMFLEEKRISVEDHKEGLRRYVISAHSSALRVKDVQYLIDALIEYFPGRLDNSAAYGVNIEHRDEFITIKTSDHEFRCSSFDLWSDKFRTRSIFPGASGLVRKPKRTIYNPRLRKSERGGRRFGSPASVRKEIEICHSDYIGEVIGLKDSRTSDALCNDEFRVQLDPPLYPESDISMLIEIKAKAGQEMMDNAVQGISEDDPTFSDEETGRGIMAEMRKIRLEILRDCMLREPEVNTWETKPPDTYFLASQRRANESGKSASRLFWLKRSRRDKHIPCCVFVSHVQNDSYDRSKLSTLIDWMIRDALGNPSLPLTKLLTGARMTACKLINVEIGSAFARSLLSISNAAKQSSAPETLFELTQTACAISRNLMRSHEFGVRRERDAIEAQLIWLAKEAESVEFGLDRVSNSAHIKTSLIPLRMGLADSCEEGEHYALLVNALTARSTRCRWTSRQPLVTDSVVLFDIADFRSSRDWLLSSCFHELCHLMLGNAVAAKRMVWVDSMCPVSKDRFEEIGVHVILHILLTSALPCADYLNIIVCEFARSNKLQSQGLREVIVLFSELTLRLFAVRQIVDGDEARSEVCLEADRLREFSEFHLCLWEQLIEHLPCSLAAQIPRIGKEKVAEASLEYAVDRFIEVTPAIDTESICRIVRWVFDEFSDDQGDAFENRRFIVGLRSTMSNAAAFTVKQVWGGENPMVAGIDGTLESKVGLKARLADGLLEVACLLSRSLYIQHCAAKDLSEPDPEYNAIWKLLDRLSSQHLDREIRRQADRFLCKITTERDLLSHPFCSRPAGRPVVDRESGIGGREQKTNFTHALGNGVREERH